MVWFTWASCPHDERILTSVARREIKEMEAVCGILAAWQQLIEEQEINRNASASWDQQVRGLIDPAPGGQDPAPVIDGVSFKQDLTRREIYHQVIEVRQCSPVPKKGTIGGIIPVRPKLPMICPRWLMP